MPDPAGCEHLARRDEQFLRTAGGKHGHPVVLPFRIADGDLTAGEVEVLDAERQGLQQAQSGSGTGA